jgi:hypothetical protein
MRKVLFSLIIGASVLSFKKRQAPGGAIIDKRTLNNTRDLRNERLL